MNFQPLKQYILQELGNGLNPNYYYHCKGHTKDVLEMAMVIANSEGVNGIDLVMLETAALIHDFGFVDTYRGHEERGCEYADLILPAFDYSSLQIDIIKGMIMKTKVPQTPESHLQRILCDADLDYLGREDFWEISDNLYRELFELNLVLNRNEWNKIQEKFIGAHQFWTETNIKKREATKQAHLAKIRSLIQV